MIVSGTTPTAKGTSSRGSGFSGSARHLSTRSTHVHPLVAEVPYLKIGLGIVGILVVFIVICVTVFRLIKNNQSARLKDENIVFFPIPETATGTSCNESVRQNHQTPEFERQNGGR